MRSFQIVNAQVKTYEGANSGWNKVQGGDVLIGADGIWSDMVLCAPQERWEKAALHRSVCVSCCIKAVDEVYELLPFGLLRSLITLDAVT